MLKIIRTDSGNPDFKGLVNLLDRELNERDGEDHAFFAQFNKIDTIRHVIVGYLSNQPVGCGAIKSYAPETAEVKRMFVLPELRGRGFAGQVLQALEHWARELGFKELVLETGKAQPEAIRLYRKAGYLTIPNYGQYAAVETSVCMKKVL